MSDGFGERLIWSQRERLLVAGSGRGPFDPATSSIGEAFPIPLESTPWAAFPKRDVVLGSETGLHKT